jgi:D-inositol-3-phosphate glycosyltransferase
LKIAPSDGASVALLTGGGDRPYAFGLATVLIAQGAGFDFIGSDELDFPELHGIEGIRVLNLRGNQRPDVGLLEKIGRIAAYYGRLLRYAATAPPPLFHILWNNKFEYFDRTLLMLYYRVLNKKIVLTVHNVNAQLRDGRDSRLNRWTLRTQYRSADHIFVHTEAMRQELLDEYGVYSGQVTVIPFGINNSVPNTSLKSSEAKQKLGIGSDEKVILFYGNVTPYKGLEYLVSAFRRVQERRPGYRLIIAGRPKGCAEYWAGIREKLREEVQSGRALIREEFIPDEETEIYFKAADVFVLPYRHIYQSGVLFLGYSFGLPVIAANVGSIRDEVLETKTGFMFQAEDSKDLADAIERYFDSDLYANLNVRRQEITDYALQRHSWDTVGRATMNVYASLLHGASSEEVVNP